MNLEFKATNIQFSSAYGFWLSRFEDSISYPSDGNETCFEIEEASFWYNHRNKVIIKVIKKNPPGEWLLEVGGGNGIVAAAISNAGINVALLEPGLNGAINSQKRGLKNVICSSLEGAGFIDNSIPAVGIFDVLEHIADDLHFLRIINSKLVEEGKLYISVPAYQFLWSHNDVNLGHYRRYSLRELKTKLELSGFVVEYKTYFFFFLPLLILLIRTIPSKLGMKKKNVIEEKKVEHLAAHNFLNTLTSHILNIEMKILSKGRRLLFGASCLIVAKKTNQLY